MVKKEEELLNSMVRVHDVETVRHFLKKGEKTSPETYDAITRVTAEVGALIVPIRELPKVKEYLKAGTGKIAAEG